VVLTLAGAIFRYSSFSPLDFLYALVILLLAMTEYGFVHSKRILLSPSEGTKKKEARKKLLEEVFQRRKENYMHLMQKKRRLQTDSDLVY
jgi:hypothetical protein